MCAESASCSYLEIPNGKTDIAAAPTQRVQGQEEEEDEKELEEKIRVFSRQQSNNSRATDQQQGLDIRDGGKEWFSDAVYLPGKLSCWGHNDCSNLQSGMSTSSSLTSRTAGSSCSKGFKHEVYLVLQQGLFKAAQPLGNRNNKRQSLSRTGACVDRHVFVAREHRYDSLLYWCWLVKSELCKKIKGGLGQGLHTAKALHTHVGCGCALHAGTPDSSTGAGVAVRL
ncbi:MAG: hypothetical protein FRX49_06117 [Trebouxia sp. A1-2]|nr:MAG: hypothetical protein FRX49_06117 [Trebouxia sp. A1-2]